MGYRQDYEKYYNTKVDGSWEVHHIDYNHDNNDMSNLVAIPDWLHHRLHLAYFRFEQLQSDFTFSDIKLHSGVLCSHTEFMSALADYVNVVNECTAYMNMRDMNRMGMN